MTTLIVTGIGCILFGAGLIVICLLTSPAYERRAEARFWGDHRPPATDDPQEWTGPLHTGGTGAGRRMTSHLRDIGFLPFKRTSEATRKAMAVLDARRPGRGLWAWLGRKVAAVTIGVPPVTDAPAEVEAAPEVHHEPAPVPELLTAPLAELGEPGRHGWVTAQALIGDTLAAEMGQVPEHVREGGSEDGLATPGYSDDNTIWGDMKAELFARLDRGDFDHDEVAS